MFSSHLFPRKAVVWSKTVTRSSSSGDGLPVSSRAGRIFAAIPKSVNQTSPLLTTGIFFLHAVKHHGAFQGRLIAKRDVLIFRSEFQKLLPHFTPLRLAQFRQFVNN